MRRQSNVLPIYCECAACYGDIIDYHDLLGRLSGIISQYSIHSDYKLLYGDGCLDHRPSRDLFSTYFTDRIVKKNSEI